MRIRGEALELAFRVVLSCPCPVTHEQEVAVSDHLRRMAPDDVVDYAPVLAIFDSTDTPFHGLAAFTSWTAEDDDPVIERHHVPTTNSCCTARASRAWTTPTSSCRATTRTSAAAVMLRSGAAAEPESDTRRLTFGTGAEAPSSRLRPVF